MMIYLDNSATTRPFNEAVNAVVKFSNEWYFNTSSAYGPAVEADRMVQGYRTQLARSMGASPDEIIYTAGATESNNMAIFGSQSARRQRGRIITTKVEHPSVLEPMLNLQRRGYEVIFLDVDAEGSIMLKQLESALCGDTALVSIMQVNNETGAQNDIAAAYSIIKRRSPEAIFHVDGVQAFCKVPFTRLTCDMYSISGHKFHGPKGIGALYVRKGTPFAGGHMGGGQERGLRSGTTNSPGIAGMGEALSLYMRNQNEYISRMRECKLRLYNDLMTIPDVLLNGPAAELGAPHILNMSFMGVRGETMLNALSQQGILVSTGSACSAHKKGSNRVLSAMGIEGIRQEGAIRFSLCPTNTVREMDMAASAIKDIVAQLRRYQRR